MLAGRTNNLKVPLAWMLGLIFNVVMLVVGGRASILSANGGVDNYMQDTYYVVVHVHSLLSLGAVFALFAGFYYWFPKITGKPYSEALGHLHFWLFFVGANLLFLPMYLLGSEAMALRVADDPDTFVHWNHIASTGYALMAIGMVVFLVNIGQALMAGKKT